MPSQGPLPVPRRPQPEPARARGWYCFGRCRRGGTIYDLAAPLYSYDPRGEDFLRLRADLGRLFGLEAIA